MCVWGGGGGGARVREFFLQRIQSYMYIKKMLFFVGRGLEEVNF